MKKILPFLPLLAAGCACKDISCPSDLIIAFSGYVPNQPLQYSDGTQSLTCTVNSSRQVTPASVPAEKVNEGFSRVCKPARNCTEKASWEARNSTLPDSLYFKMDLQLVTPAHTQAAVIFPQGTVRANGDSYAFTFSPELESLQASRTITDTVVGQRSIKKMLIFSTSGTNSLSRFYLAQDAGIVGFTLQRTGQTFWRTDL